GFDDGGGVELFDDGGAGEGGGDGKLFAGVDRRVDPCAIEPDRAALDQRGFERCLAARWVDQSGEVDVGTLADDRGVEVDEVGADFGKLDAEAREIGLFE